MEMRSSFLLLWPFLAACALFAFSCLALTPDGVALLEFKNSLNDSKYYLSNWSPSDASPCKWTGVICHNDRQSAQAVNLPYMKLGGIISPSIGKLSKLQRLALHSNSLHGTIPIEISNCSNLRALYLRGNYLQGSIPAALGNLSNLFILDLSSNSLKGAIPATIGRLNRLRHLNLSTNFFTGEIPTVGVLGHFGRNSFVGNLDLCGQQLLKPCQTSLVFPAVLPHAGSEEDTAPKKQPSRYITGILIGSVSTLGALMAVVFLFLSIRTRTKKERAIRKYQEVENQAELDANVKLLTFHGDMPYPSSEIVEKLESVNEEHIVGSGGFGTVYRMVMNDCGIYAVKRIDRSRDESDQVFERELGILGGIKHINLVNLRGYCRLPASKLLIYDFLVMGSLEDLLHGKSEDQPLNWRSRLKIALGSARGLAYLHHDCCPSIVHSNIKSSNILLDENLEPHVSDFGLAELLVDEDAHLATVVAGTSGYLAPEYLQSGKATEKSDVYSFGVLLLELVTGKKPSDPSFLKRGLNLVGWMHNLLRDNRLVEEVVDKRCTGADAETIESLLEIAARCTYSNPDERPSMNRVLQSLEQDVVSPHGSDFGSHSDCC